MSSSSPDIVDDFALEARELLDQLGGQLVALEQMPDDRELLNAVFRAFHTIKGGAGFLGATALVELCHAAEECLGAARNGSANLLPRHFDAAQQSLDWLQAMVDAVEQRSPVPEAPAELVAAFALDEAGAEAPTPEPAPAAAPVAPAAAGGDMISDDEFEALLDQLHGGAAPGLTEAPAAAAPPAPAEAVPPAAPPAPKPVPKPAAKAAPPPPSASAEREQTVRVNTRRLDTIVDLVGELVLARNRLKTLR